MLSSDIYFPFVFAVLRLMYKGYTKPLTFVKGLVSRVFSLRLLLRHQGK